MEVTMQMIEDPVVKNHFNLPTYQRRLRHLQSIAVRNLNCPGDEEIDLCHLTVYFTLHKHVKHKAFYTSEKITGSLNPTWQSFGLQRCDSNVDLSAKSVVVRIWCGQGEKFKVKIEADVHFSGLLFLSSKSHLPGIKHQADTLLFGLFNHVFIHYDKSCGNTHLEQLLPDTEAAKLELISVMRVEQTACRPSYRTSNLTRIHTVQRAISQTLASVKRIHSSIEDRLLSSNENSEKLSQREVLLMKVRQLRQELLWQGQQKQAEQDKLEKYQMTQTSRLNTLREKGTQLRQLVSDTEEKRTLHIQSREMLVKENAQVVFRRKQIIREMVHDIYTITEDEKTHHFYICNIRLPNAEDYQGQDDLRVSVALGFTCHLTQMISHFMDLPLRYPMVHRGSRSTVIDDIHSKLTEKDREFPLFGKGKEKFQYNYAVFLLNKNISQLRFYCGLVTNDLRQTLPNLKSLLEQRLGVRSSSSLERIDVLTFQSPPPTSIGGSQVSRMSQPMSSNASSNIRRDLAPDLDSQTPSISRSTSATGEGISLANFTENSSLRTIPKIGHSMSFPQTTIAHPQVAYGLDNFDFDTQVNLASPSSHIYSLENANDSKQLTFQGENSPVSCRAKDSLAGENVIKEEEEGEDIFKPSDDNFFEVRNQQSVLEFNKIFHDMQNGDFASTSNLNNGIISQSDILLDTAHRSFKLLKTSAVSPLPDSDVSLAGSQRDSADSFIGHKAENSICDTRFSEDSPASRDADGNSFSPSSSFNESDVDPSSQGKSGS